LTSTCGFVSATRLPCSVLVNTKVNNCRGPNTVILVATTIVINYKTYVKYGRFCRCFGVIIFWTKASGTKVKASIKAPHSLIKMNLAVTMLERKSVLKPKVNRYALAITNQGRRGCGWRAFKFCSYEFIIIAAIF
jgi:hypothetical protein